MKLLIISPYFYPQISARALQVKKLVDGLKVKGIKSKIISLKNGKEDNIEVNKYEVKYIRLKNNLFSKSGLYSEIRFVFRAYFIVEQTIKNFKPDIILSICVPEYSHYVPLLMKNKIKNIKWISFFSDPRPCFIQLPKYYIRKTNFLKKIMRLVLIKRVFKYSDNIIFPSKRMVSFMENKINVSIKSKVSVIPHIGKYANSNQSVVKNRNLVHIGTLRHRFSSEILEGIVNFKEKYPYKFNKLLLYGHYDEKIGEYIKDNNYSKYIKFKGLISHKKVQKTMQSSFCLLLLEANMKFSPYLPSKIAEYVMMNRPVLIVTPEQSEIIDICKKYNYNNVSSHNKDNIFLKLKNIFVDENFQLKQLNDMKEYFLEKNIINKYIKIFKANELKTNYSDKFQ